jgi:hypothetical protein
MFGSTKKYDAQVSVSELETGKQVITQEGKETIDDASKLHGELSADGKKLAIRENNSVRLVEIASGRNIINPILQDDIVTAAAFGQQGTLLLTGTKDGAVMIWDASNGKALSQPMLHPGEIDAVAMSDDGTRIVTATADRTIRIWDVKSGEALTPPISCPGDRLTTISSVGFSLHDSIVFARSTSIHGTEFQGSLSIWEIPSWGKDEVPEWFLKMAESIGGRRLDQRGVPLSISSEESKENRRSELTREGGGTAIKLAKKLLAPETKNTQEQRTIAKAQFAAAKPTPGIEESRPPVTAAEQQVASANKDVLRQELVPEWRMRIKPKHVESVESAETLPLAVNANFTKNVPSDLTQEDLKDLPTAVALFKPQNLPFVDKDLIGSWRCRSILVDDLGVFTYPFFSCRFVQKKGQVFFEKTSGSQRRSGHLYRASGDHMVFLGSLTMNDDVNSGEYTDTVGVLVRKASKRFLLILDADPKGYEVYEIVK